MPTQNLHGCTLPFTLTQQEFSTELFPRANTLMLILNQTMPPLCSGFSPPSPLQFLKGIFILYLFHSIHLYGTSLSSDLNLTMLIVNSQLSRLNSSSASRISLLPWAPHLPRHQVFQMKLAAEPAFIVAFIGRILNSGFAEPNLILYIVVTSILTVTTRA